ncbi:Mpp6p Ecym_2092 [Eremothecium cymbalariae DBVPG|uniref:M-phase phosphoprotein 6 n=1 Tax=Eremothecium cymbalariae (strain CBS 270.75 / DBVPG 7215 / KCTC 17166 / NRRL Y-17582) TaxID=931890 RepID=G8JPJ6_ERECY|nr:Hypothetical protein Ecym_2092 [Eremothecium cymbalariae DBVPG\
MTGKGGGNAVSGKLSSRVMNMKFMRHVDDQVEGQEQKGYTKTPTDSSQWKLKGSEKYLKRILKPKQMTVMGHTAVRRFNLADNIGVDGKEQETLPSSSLNIGRKVYTSTEKTTAASTTASIDTQDPSDLAPVAIRKRTRDESLEDLWNSGKNTKRPKKGSNTDVRSNAKTKKPKK